MLRAHHKSIWMHSESTHIWKYSGTLYNTNCENRAKNCFTCSHIPVKYSLLQVSCTTQSTELLICDVHLF